nr:MAG TPA: hypothetical protein [Caudoviricetes sp.]
MLFQSACFCKWLLFLYRSQGSACLLLIMQM